MHKVEPNLDAYGTHVRASALADVLELQAIQHPTLSLAELADWVRDNGWIRSLDESINEPTDEELGDLGEEVDASLAAANRVFDVIAERIDSMGDRYPFVLHDGRLRYNGPDDFSSAYMLLLLITVSHAYDLQTGVNPRYYFEDVVATCLQQRGFLAGNVAKHRRGVGTLAEAVINLGAACDLTVTPRVATYRVRAQEEGVDVVAHLPWSDRRPIHWVYLVQATCGRSDSWPGKIQEPSIQMWRNLLGLRVNPTALLAVPHHIPNNVLHYVTEKSSGERLVLDRVRLASLDVSQMADAARLLAELNALVVGIQ